MADLEYQARAGAPAAANRRLTAFGEEFARIESQFALNGGLGVVLLEASHYAGLESTYGCEARRLAMSNLHALVNEIVGDELSIDDMILGGESGRGEIVVLLFRDTNEPGFYKRELPALSARLMEGIARRGHRVAYPYLTSAPLPNVGIGAALRNPTLAADTQLRHALEEARDDALLNAKIEARRRRRQLMELVLEGQVRSVFEPIVEVETRTVFGYEALARGPEGSELHSAGALFQAATDEDLLFQLDCLCRQSALAGARELPGESKLFLNVRPTTIHDPNFRAEALIRTLEKCGLRPTDVVFEISEQESIGNFAIFREVRDYYRKLGFQIALDDTGSGYASLEAVMELSPEFIKIDGAFVKGIDEDPARQQLVRALRTVAEQINARIIGEGLDRLEELEMLGKLGIPFGQGWLFGKPTPLRHDT
jgi:EAL domain-containing protein (putative c-di-GMP-specific phosphodiesterase class I)